jgi:hypothetical protein
MAETKKKNTEKTLREDAVLSDESLTVKPGEAEIPPQPREKETIYDDAYYNERVPFEAFYDGDRYKDDIFVSVNGESFLIKRGEKVMIPRKVLEVLQNSEEQKRATARMIAKEEQKFKNMFK